MSVLDSAAAAIAASQAAISEYRQQQQSRSSPAAVRTVSAAGTTAIQPAIPVTGSRGGGGGGGGGSIFADPDAFGDYTTADTDGLSGEAKEAVNAVSGVDSSGLGVAIVNDKSRSGKELDDLCISVALEIERDYASLPRALKIRVEHWVYKLSALSAYTPPHKILRNQYAELLLEQVKRKRLDVPFDRLPTQDQSLPPLPKFMVHTTHITTSHVGCVALTV